jgi:hypothetical protein
VGQEHARLTAGPPPELAGDRLAVAPGPAVLTRQQLLRRLARLDVVLCPADGGPPTVRSASGATAAVRAGRWSAADVDALLAELGLSALDFQDTR